MRSPALPAVFVLITAGVAAASSPVVTTEYGIEFVSVTDPGNIPFTGGPGYAGDYGASLNVEGRGRVDYHYRVSRSELTAGRYLAFLNIFAPQSAELADALKPSGGGLREDFLASLGVPGDVWELSPGQPMAERSPVGLTWRQSAMYVNWLHNGMPADPASLTTGAYEIDLSQSPFLDPPEHNPGARYWIPSIDEYMKAVHYDPHKNGEGPGWWLYPHASDEPPTTGLPGEGETIRGITQDEVEAYFGTRGATLIGFPLGLYPGTQSPWGVTDVLGGMAEWMEGSVEFGVGLRPINRVTNFADPRDGHELVFAIDDATPGTFGGLRIATVIPAPPAVGVAAFAFAFYRRSRNAYA